MSNPVIYVDLGHTPESDEHKALGDDRPRWQGWSALILAAGNHEPLFKSTEKYTNRGDALNAVQLAFGPDSIVYLREADRGNVLVRHPEPWPAP